MDHLTDQELLRDYAEHRSDAAFAELVRRQVDFVYSAALRLVVDGHLAKDVTQGTFAALAQNAPALVNHPVLSGWLHRTTRNLAANTVRSEVRRRGREKEAATMNESPVVNSEAAWDEITPHLDAALEELSEPDRDAILLRYFENKNLNEIGRRLNLSEDAARKRVARAVEKMRGFFTKRKITIGASGLAVLLSANAVQSAPVGLAVTVSAAALAGSAVSTSTLIVSTTKTLVMTTLQKTLATTAIVVLAGAGTYEAHQAAQLHDQTQKLQTQQAALNSELAKLRVENEQLSGLLAEAKQQKKMNAAQFSELLKLRGQSGQARLAVQELAQSRAAGNGMSALVTNAMAQGMNVAAKFKKREVADKVARMKAMLHLSDDQAQAVSDLMLRHIDEDSQRLLQAMSQGQMTGQLVSPATSADEEVEIKALLTPDQLAGYDAFKQADAQAAADKSAASEVERMTDELSLSAEQQEQIRPLLAQNALNSQSSADKSALAQANATNDFATALNLRMQAEQKSLANKLKLLSGILTPDQLQKYQQSEQDEIEMGNSALKMFLPQTNGASGQ